MYFPRDALLAQRIRQSPCEKALSQAVLDEINVDLDRISYAATTTLQEDFVCGIRNELFGGSVSFVPSKESCKGALGAHINQCDARDFVVRIPLTGIALLQVLGAMLGAFPTYSPSETDEELLSPCCDALRDFARDNISGCGHTWLHTLLTSAAPMCQKHDALAQLSERLSSTGCNISGITRVLRDSLLFISCHELNHLVLRHAGLSSSMFQGIITPDTQAGHDQALAYCMELEADQRAVVQCVDAFVARHDSGGLVNVLRKSLGAVLDCEYGDPSKRVTDFVTLKTPAIVAHGLATQQLAEGENTASVAGLRMQALSGPALLTSIVFASHRAEGTLDGNSAELDPVFRMWTIIRSILTSAKEYVEFTKRFGKWITDAARTWDCPELRCLGAGIVPHIHRHTDEFASLADLFRAFQHCRRSQLL